MNVLLKVPEVGTGAMAGSVRRRALDIASMSDEALMWRVVEEDRRAFDILMSRHRLRVTGLAGRIVYRAGDAEDAAQDAFINVWKYKNTWIGWNASFVTWLNRITVHKCYDYNRKHRECELTEAHEPTSQAPNAFSLMHVSQVGSQLRSALAALTDNQRQAMMMYYHEGMSAKECAAALNMKVSAVEALLKRGRGKLRDLLRHADFRGEALEQAGMISLVE